MSFVPKCFENVHQILGIKVEPGTADNIKKELKKSPKVAAVYVALGDYDIISLLSIEDPQELTHFVVERVRKMKGVLDTQPILIKK